MYIIVYFCFMETINKRIERLRVEKKLTQIEVAKALGLSRSGYLLIENNENHNISLSTAIKLAKVLDTSFNELFEIDDPYIEEEFEELWKENDYYKERNRSRRALLRTIKKNLESTRINLNTLKNSELIDATLEQILLSIEEFEQFNAIENEVARREEERKIKRMQREQLSER